MRGSISCVRSVAINKAQDHSAAMAFALEAQFKQLGKLAAEAFPVGIEHVGAAAQRGQRNFARHNVAVDIRYGRPLGQHQSSRLAVEARIIDLQRGSVDRVFPRNASGGMLKEPDTGAMVAASSQTRRLRSAAHVVAAITVVAGDPHRYGDQVLRLSFAARGPRRRRTGRPGRRCWLHLRFGWNGSRSVCMKTKAAPHTAHQLDQRANMIWRPSRQRCCM